jgi:hypothetical protein
MLMTKKSTKYMPLPKIAFQFTDEVLANSIHRLSPVNEHIVIVTSNQDVGAIISRVARMLKPSFNVYVKSDSNVWMRHFELVGVARHGYKVYTRRSERSDSDVQPTRQVIQVAVEDTKED